jgi:hypothetical protein
LCGKKKKVEHASRARFDRLGGVTGSGVKHVTLKTAYISNGIPGNHSNQPTNPPLLEQPIQSQHQLLPTNLI